jgi:hypothetical protein
MKNFTEKKPMTARTARAVTIAGLSKIAAAIKIPFSAVGDRFSRFLVLDDGELFLDVLKATEDPPRWPAAGRDELDVLCERVVGVSGSQRGADAPDATAKDPVPRPDDSEQAHADLGEHRRSSAPLARPQ